MSTITLESIQNELIREILDIKNVKVLESVRKTLVHAKKEMDLFLPWWQRMKNPT